MKRYVFDVVLTVFTGLFDFFNILQSLAYKTHHFSRLALASFVFEFHIRWHPFRHKEMQLTQPRLSVMMIIISTEHRKRTPQCEMADVTN
jgi:hypothetical protein